jgi:hypothetical protein
MRRLKQALLGLFSIAIILLVWRPGWNVYATATLAGLVLYLLPIVALPLALYVLLRFAYRMFARPYLRLLRMRRYLSNKELQEAARRGR